MGSDKYQAWKPITLGGKPYEIKVDACFTALSTDQYPEKFAEDGRSRLLKSADEELARAILGRDMPPARPNPKKQDEWLVVVPLKDGTTMRLLEPTVEKLRAFYGCPPSELTSAHVAYVLSLGENDSAVTFENTQPGDVWERPFLCGTVVQCKVVCREAACWTMRIIANPMRFARVGDPAFMYREDNEWRFVRRASAKDGMSTKGALEATAGALAGATTANERPVATLVTRLTEGAVYINTPKEFADSFGCSLREAEDLFKSMPPSYEAIAAMAESVNFMPKIQPRCGQTWQLRKSGRDERSGQRFEIYDFHEHDGPEDNSFSIRFEDGSRDSIMTGDLEMFSTYVSGPTTPEMPREAFERVIRLEAEDVPEGLSKAEWMNRLLGHFEPTESGYTKKTAANARWGAAHLRKEHAERWSNWAKDASRRVNQ